MSVSVKLDVKGMEKIVEDLKAMADRTGSLYPAMAAGAAEVSKLISNSFRYSRSPDDTPWLPLSEATKEHRRGGSNKPLVDTGILQAGSYAYAENDHIVYGSRPIYAASQNFGYDFTGTYSSKILTPRRVSHTAATLLGVRLRRSYAARSMWEERKKRAALRERFGSNYFSGTQYENEHKKKRKRKERARMHGPARKSASDILRERAGSQWTVKLPARPFLPYDKTTGEFMNSGSAARSIQKISKYILDYIANGKTAGGEGAAP